MSEIPFTHAYRDSSGSVITDEVKLAAHRPYAYLPIVAGGTSFMYHIDINGRRYTNLQLSPDTIAKIFTGVIKNWNDPAIAADNPQLHAPELADPPDRSLRRIGYHRTVHRVHGQSDFRRLERVLSAIRAAT